ncbi:MAG: epimerase [Elusimicrobia bacterium GWC2_63_65]|nr:MAG: epimerase [Elusimicrobia bacterium GWC2_63_65]
MANKEKVLLTGGSGFIGRNLLESSLSVKYELLAPSHSDLDLLDDGAVAGYFSRNKIDFVVHTACKPGHRNAKDPSALFYSNTRMFFNLAANSRRYRRMLVIGSGAVYDMRHYRPKMKEEYFGEHIPEDEHGFSKYVCGRQLESAANIVDLRVFGIFGKYEDYAIRFISNMICKALFDLPLTMKQNRRFDYLRAEDLFPVIEFFLANKPAHKAYNVTPDDSIELLELARLVLKISGKSLPIEVAQPGLGLEYSGDNSRLRGEVKALAFTPVERAVKELFDWYSARKSELDKGLLLADK